MTPLIALDSVADLGPLYQDYAYGYPHKSAYRTLKPAIPLKQAWANTDASRTFLYLHIPFCEMRCGFCNLFTTANPSEDRIAAYLFALEREARLVRSEIGATPVQVAFGGGTPTFLSPDELSRVLGLIESTFELDLAAIPMGIETSPATATTDRLSILASRGTERISIGVQSFVEAETKQMGRPQKPGTAEAALDRIRQHTFPRLNIDLIYGAANQTEASWLHSLKRAMQWQPEEIYLYPLYIRTRTGLDGKSSVEDEHRRTLYRAGRVFLLSEGYHQNSIRSFSKLATGNSHSEYVCQEDGMIGLGVGARSYTRDLHYSSPYAVSREGVLGIVDAYCKLTEQDLITARHGIEISRDERARRYVLKSILHASGLKIPRFTAEFGVHPTQMFPALSKLIDMGLMVSRQDRIGPTPLGLEHADAIPPLFYSDAVSARMSKAIVS